MLIVGRKVGCGGLRTWLRLTFAGAGVPGVAGRLLVGRCAIPHQADDPSFPALIRLPVEADGKPTSSWACRGDHDRPRETASPAGWGFPRSVGRRSCVMGLKPNGGNARQAWFRRSQKPGPKGNAQTCSEGNICLIGSGWKRIHQDECCALPLMDIDKRHQPREMFGPAMRVQSSPVRPFLYENEMSGVFLVDEQVIGDAEFFLPGLFDQLAVKRQNDLASGLMKS